MPIPSSFRFFFFFSLFFFLSFCNCGTELTWQLSFPCYRYSVRRAALRAASSSIRAAAAVPRQQVASFAVHVSKVNTKPAATLRLARAFSQTARAAQEEEAGDAAAEKKPSEFPAEDGTSIYISNMTFDATEVHLKEAFAQYGEIADIRIVKDGRGLSRGYVLRHHPAVSAPLVPPSWIFLPNSLPLFPPGL